MRTVEERYKTVALERTLPGRFSKLEDVRIERRPYQYLYEDPTGYIFAEPGNLRAGSNP